MIMKKRSFVLIVTVFICLFGISLSPQETPTLESIDNKYLRDKTVENCEKAIEEYKILLQERPNNYKVLAKISAAYIDILDIKTSALIIEKDEYKPILKKLGKLANDYAKKAYELNPRNKDAIAVNLVSYGYYSASFGIVKAILKGAAGHYKELANQLIEVDDAHLGALGYRSLGKLYHVAPWPVGNKSKALKFFKKAVETDGTVLYSRYYLGMLYYQDKKYDLAEQEFIKVRDNEPSIHDKHFIKAYKDGVTGYLAIIKNLKKKR